MQFHYISRFASIQHLNIIRRTLSSRTLPVFRRLTQSGEKKIHYMPHLGTINLNFKIFYQQQRLLVRHIHIDMHQLILRVIHKIKMKSK